MANSCPVNLQHNHYHKSWRLKLWFKHMLIDTGHINQEQEANMMNVVRAIQHSETKHVGLQHLLALWLNTCNLFTSCALSDGQLVMNSFGIFYRFWLIGNKNLNKKGISKSRAKKIKNKILVFCSELLYALLCCLYTAQAGTKSEGARA